MLDRNEMERVEFERLIKLFPTLLGFIKRKVYEPEKLYPEFKLEEPYGEALSLGHRRPIHVLAPFYRNIILPIDPFKTKSSFKRAYGMSIKEMAQLVRDKKIIPLLSGGYRYYPSFYDYLFKVDHIPRANRAARALITRRDVIGPDIRKIVYEKLNPKLAPKNLKSRVIFGKYYRDIVSDELKVLGIFYPKLVNKLLDIERPDIFFITAVAYHRFLTNSISWSLNGWSNYIERDIKIAKFVNFPLDRITNEKVIALPLSLLYGFISKGLKYEHPLNVKPLEYWNKISKENEEVLEALKEFQEYCNKLYFGKAYEIVDEDIPVVLNDLNKKINKISDTGKKVKSFIDFSFVSLTPSVLGIIQPLIGVMILPVIWGFKEVSKKRYNKIIAGVAEFFTECMYASPKLVGKNIAPALLWKLRHPTKPS